MTGKQPLTPDDWKDYEADRMLAKVYKMRQELMETHSMKHLIEMQRAWDKRVSTSTTEGGHDGS